jgi:hypothetical protein
MTINERRNCYHCGGTGTHACNKCKGSGHCHVCDGRGTKIVYPNKDVECSLCEGSGNCDLCNGAGQQACGVCDGRGYLDY